MSTEQTCSNCGGQLFAGDRFCAHCGAQQEGGTVAPPEQEESGARWDPVLHKLRDATAGKYEIGRVLGAGGMAAVYLGREVRLNRPVAIKVMSPGLMLAPGMVERFRQEAVTVAALNHANIVTIYTVEETEDLHFFVMKHIAGPPLETVIRRDGPLPKSVVKVWLTQVGSALAYAHRRGVIHRDIKPANILLDDEGNAIVTDFGIAKVPRKSSLTQTGMTLGTPAYMSPEQCSSQAVTAASDQYSLGIVTYEMLTGEPPFTGPSLEVMKAHVEQPPRPITVFRPHAPPELVAAVNRMLEKNAQDRWPSMEDMIGAIGGTPIAHDDPIRAQLAALATTGGPRARKHRAAAAPSATPPAAQPVMPPASPVTPPPASAVTPPPMVEPGLPEYLEPATPVPVASLVLAPVPPKLWVGHTLRLEATPQDASGLPLEGREVTWRSSDASVAAVSAAGMVEAFEPGSVTIAAACEGQIATVTIDVIPVYVESVKVRPARRVMAVGHTVGMRAILRGSDGSRLYDRPVSWTSNNPAVAEVAADGAVTALTEGNVEVKATSEEQSATAALKVTAAGAPYLIGRFWWTAPAAAVALLALWLAVRPADRATRIDDGDQSGQLSGAQGDQGGAGQGVVDPTDTTSEDAGDRAIANAAHTAAMQARDGALAAGARETYAADFGNLQQQLSDGESALQTGDLRRALALLDPLPRAFDDLAQLSTEMSTATSERARSESATARTNARQRRDAAVAAGAPRLRPSELARLNGLLNGAESRYRAGDYVAAQSQFSGLERAYRQLAETCRRAARSEAEGARSRAAQHRERAVEGGAEDRAPQELRAIDANRDQAHAMVSAGTHLDALLAFEQVERAYRALADSVTALPAVETEGAAAETELRPARVVLTERLELFRQLFEQRDLNGMSEQLYRGPVPASDERLLRAVFDNAEEIEAEIQDPDISVEGTSATATIQLSLDFRQLQSGRRYADVKYRFRLSFAEDSGGWRLHSIERG